MTISLIVAVSENQVIGKDNKLIWRLPNDLKLFKSLTMGHKMIMGRKTFESIGKPLPGRTTVIITRQKDYTAEGCIVTHSLSEALSIAGNEEEVFIIGGDQIFKEAFPIADKVYFTRVHHAFEGDTFFPVLSENEWEVTDQHYHKADEKHLYDYSFITYVKKK